MPPWNVTYTGIDSSTLLSISLGFCDLVEILLSLLLAESNTFCIQFKVRFCAYIRRSELHVHSTTFSSHSLCLFWPSAANTHYLELEICFWYFWPTNPDQWGYPSLSLSANQHSALCVGVDVLCTAVQNLIIYFPYKFISWILLQ